MNYTIAWLEEAHSGFNMDYGKNGNKYYISVHDKESGIYRSREFERQDEAVQIFVLLTAAVCRGEYSFEDRVKILMGGESK